ncbi:MAG: hypothetical protein LIP77_01295, partial [Planctomycetes bacterium]|nr:hypothetical protein [Planctomycetota bacterium]
MPRRGTIPAGDGPEPGRSLSDRLARRGWRVPRFGWPLHLGDWHFWSICHPMLKIRIWIVSFFFFLFFGGALLR